MSLRKNATTQAETEENHERVARQYVCPCISNSRGLNANAR